MSRADIPLVPGFEFFHLPDRDRDGDSFEVEQAVLIKIKQVVMLKINLFTAHPHARSTWM
jgi:hypothetical protein